MADDHGAGALRLDSNNKQQGYADCDQIINMAGAGESWHILLHFTHAVLKIRFVCMNELLAFIVENK